MILSLFTKRHIKDITDEALINLIKNSQVKKGIGEVYNRYSLMLFGVALKYMKNKMDAEDILMHVFEKLPSKIESNDIKNLKNWLYTIVKNDCLMQLRKNKIPHSEIDDALLYTPQEQSNIIELLIKEQKFTELERAIDQLKKEQKECIELFYLKQFCYDKIAQDTGFELKKVKSYIQNGKRNLKLILEQKDVFKSS